MTVTDFIAALALVVSGASFGIQAAQWFSSGPKIKLSLIADAVEFPKTDGKPKLALTVTNRGDAPTMVTHMFAFCYETRWQRIFQKRKPKKASVVDAVNLPGELKPGHYWMGLAIYDKQTVEQRTLGQLYVGVICSHTDKYFMVHVPPARDAPLLQD
jgi:hypothetical protein